MNRAQHFIHILHENGYDIIISKKELDDYEDAEKFYNAGYRGIITATDRKTGKMLGYILTKEALIDDNEFTAIESAFEKKFKSVGDIFSYEIVRDGSLYDFAPMRGQHD